VINGALLICDFNRKCTLMNTGHELNAILPEYLRFPVGKINFVIGKNTITGRLWFSSLFSLIHVIFSSFSAFFSFLREARSFCALRKYHLPLLCAECPFLV
jgi:hypothetical protein